MKDSSMTLKIPLDEKYLPNITAQIDLVGAASRTNDKGEVDPKLAKRPAFASGNINLSISTDVAKAYGFSRAAGQNARARRRDKDRRRGQGLARRAGREYRGRGRRRGRKRPGAFRVTAFPTRWAFSTPPGAPERRISPSKRCSARKPGGCKEAPAAAAVARDERKCSSEMVAAPSPSAGAVGRVESPRWPERTAMRKNVSTHNDADDQATAGRSAAIRRSTCARISMRWRYFAPTVKTDSNGKATGRCETARQSDALPHHGGCGGSGQTVRQERIEYHGQTAADGPAFGAAVYELRR